MHTLYICPARNKNHCRKETHICASECRCIRILEKCTLNIFQRSFQMIVVGFVCHCVNYDSIMTTNVRKEFCSKTMLIVSPWHHHTSTSYVHRLQDVQSEKF